MAFWKNKTVWKGFFLLAAIATLVILSRVLPVAEWTEAFVQWVTGQGVAGVGAFIAVYVLGTVLFFPGSILTIAAGVTFGLGWGVLIVSLSSTTGASLAFLIGRYFARGLVEKRAQSNVRFKAVDNAVGQEGWKIVGLLRLSPLIPFNLANYFFGLTQVRFWPYVLASWIGMMPGTVLYVYLGYIGKATLAGTGDRTPAEFALLVVGLLATVAVTIYLTRLAKQNLKKYQSDADSAEDGKTLATKGETS